MAKLRKWIGNLKVSAKLQVYRMAVLVMTAFFVLVALVSTLVIRSTIHSITEVWSPSLECLQELQTITAKYRIKQYQHLVETDTAAMAACEKETNDMENQIKDISSKLEKIINSNKKAQVKLIMKRQALHGRITGQPQIKYISLVEKANRLMLLIL